MGSLAWLLQWPIRALILLLVARLPLGVEMASFPVALLSAVVIGLLGTLLIWPLKLILGPIWAVTSLGGIISPVSFLFNWLITVILFGLAAWLIKGFQLKNGLVSAILGALAYSVLSSLVLGWLGLDVPLTRAMAATTGLG
ncbi:MULTISPECIES: phage holin family protein [unclassified Cyanobium]|uniref:phage holin family protein n=1 Tax=unclassified Cyanobium TaxID=2627006 RepID=UPI0020CF6D81|nr:MULTISPECIES: phage holin family protein [unclassified Cyanobium]MCP9834399.1 phage holin family protein [Cyanobium sp. La Preciosa 7G6]MCP9937229.1 phage holin family protein [Cyanobium sp. Aljojuca 7A6]